MQSIGHYRESYSSSLAKNLKSYTSTILNTEIEGEFLFDLLVRYQNNHFTLCHA